MTGDELLNTLVDLLAERVAERLEGAQRPSEFARARAAERPASPYLTVVEAAELLRCKRQRVDDLLSRGRLTRLKEGGRTLVRRTEVEALVEVERVAIPRPPAVR